MIRVKEAPSTFDELVRLADELRDDVPASASVRIEFLVGQGYQLVIGDA